MTNTVLLKRSSVANSVPGAGNLSLGELALNYTDGNLFYKNAGGAVTVIASNQFSSVVGNVTANNVVATTIVSAASHTGTIVSVTGNITGGNLLTSGQISSTGNITSAANITGGNITTTGLISSVGNITGANITATYFYGDGSGITNISAAGGYFNSTLTSFPGSAGNIDYGNGEAYVGQVASTDAFAVEIVPNFSCMDPQGSIPTATDLGAIV